MANDVAYEFYASQSGLEPKDIFTKSTHEREFYSPGDPGNVSVKLLQVEYWRENSGLDPEAYTDNEHLDAWIAKLKLSGYDDDWADSLRADIISQRNEFVNLATNPQFKRVVPGTAIVRRNLLPRPSFGHGLYAGWGKAGSTSRVITSVVELDGAQVLRVETNGTSSYLGTYTTNTPYKLSPGATYAASIVVKGPVDAPYRLEFREWSSDPNAIQSTIQERGTFSGEWQTISLVRTVALGKNIDKGDLVFRITEAVAHVFYVRTAIVEQRPSVLPHFDGDTADDLGFVYEWEGTPYASTSVMKASPVEVRRNLVLNPRGIGASGSTPGFGWVNQWAGGPSGGTFFSELPGGGVRREWLSSADRNWEVGFGVRQDVTEGETISVSMVVRFDFGSTTPPGGSDNGYKLRARFHDVDNNVLANVYSSEFYSYSTLSDGVPRTFSISGIVVPPGATSVLVNPQYRGSANASPLPQTGFAMEISKPIVEYAPVLLPYFDGDTTPDADLMPVWTGTPNESASTLIGAIPAQAVSNVDGGRIGVYAFAREAVKVYGLNEKRDSFVYATGVEAGKSYSILGTIRLDAPQVAPTSIARCIVLQSSSGRVAQSLPAPNVAGLHEVRLDVSIPSDKTSLRVRLYHGSSFGDTPVYWESLFIIENGPYDGTYDGPYFDGDSPGALWLGEPHASASGV